MFVMVALKVFGISESQFSGQLKFGLIAVVILVLVVGVMAYIREQASIPTGDDVDYTKTVSIIFHPKVLGIVFVLLVAVFTIVLLAAKQT
ncbi:hypothetical protein ACFLZ6_00550, partial [Nanoarchaeota archaeon]